MQADPELVRRHLARLPDEELLRVVRFQATGYSEEARALAGEELTLRGLDAQAVQQQAAALTSSHRRQEQTNVETIPERPKSSILVIVFGVFLFLLIGIWIISSIFPGQYRERKRGEGHWEHKQGCPRSGGHWELHPLR